MVIFGWLRPVKQGVVIGKNHYGATTERFGGVVGTKTSAYVAPNVAGETDRYSLIVRDRFANRTQEIYVWPMQWSNTEIGDIFKGVDNE